MDAHFSLSHITPAAPLPPPGLPLARRVAELWPHLIRSAEEPPCYSSLLALPRRYVVPGGRFQELYYRDFYFTMLRFGPAEDALRRDMIADFAFEVRHCGHIPNANRTYHLSRSQPPFFVKMIGTEALVRYLPEIKEECACWMQGARRAAPDHPVRNVVAMPDRSLINRYWDARDAPRDESCPADLAVARSSGRTRANSAATSARLRLDERCHRRVDEALFPLRSLSYAAIRGLWKNSAWPIVARTASRENGLATR